MAMADLLYVCQRCLYLDTAESGMHAGSACWRLDSILSIHHTLCAQVKVLYKRKSRGYGVIVPTLD